ncbi:MAG TPA: FAD-dependent monooxygenase [Alphaproteobacteria bacterium]
MAERGGGEGATKVPVVIAGGGPVGMTLANFLHFYGVPCLVVNREKSSRLTPKGSTHNSRSMEHYRRLGLARAIRKLGLPADHPTDVGYFTRLTSWELARLAMPSEAEKMRRVAAAAPADQVPEPIFRCNQMYVERYLFEHLKSLPSVAMRYGWSCVGFTDRGGDVRVEIEEADTGRRETYACDYLAGCDGGQGVVRRGLAIRYAGETLNQDYMGGTMVASYLRAPDLYRTLDRPRCWQYWMVNRDVRGNVISIDGADEFQMGTQLRAPDDPIDEREMARRFRAAIGVDVAFEFLRHARWRGGQALVADRFGQGRVWLAGDAVHLFSPTGGFGLNTGVDDAANLAWKLAALVQGWGGPALAASYEAERRPIAIRNTSASARLARNVGAVPIGPAIDADSPDGAAARGAASAFLSNFGEEFASLGVQLGARYDDSPIVVPDGTAPPAFDAVVYRPSACPGGRAPHFWLDGHVSLFDRLGRGFTLLRFDGCRADAAPLAHAARACGVPFSVLDVDGDEARDLYERGLALVRPDQHVAWRGDRLPEDCAALIARVTGWGGG